jgi:hypothetical protein
MESVFAIILIVLYHFKIVLHYQLMTGKRKSFFEILYETIVGMYLYRFISLSFLWFYFKQFETEEMLAVKRKYNNVVMGIFCCLILIILLHNLPSLGVE